MKITALKLHDFRCFDDLEITFSEQYNTHVIIAENMAGKSALMRALRITAHAYVSGLVTIQGYGIESHEHRILGRHLITDISLTSSVEAKALIKDEKGTMHKLHWRKHKEKPHNSRTKTELLTPHNPASFARNVYKNLTQTHLPLINFIGTEYIHVLSSETDRFALEGDAIQGYRDCLNDKSIKKFLFDWLSQIDGILAEKSRKKIISAAYGNLPEDALFVFQKAVKSLLPDIVNFEWLADKKQPIVEFQNGDIRLFDMLSDGYRYLILLAGELATRAIILNKHLGKKVLETITGLVMIDEFGIHLHPLLQNEALLRLQNTFPNVQFILSTHSPLLINGLKKEQIHLLDVDSEGKRTVQNPDEDVVGLGADGILRTMFGLTTTYDKAFLEMNEEYKQLLSKKSDLTTQEQTRFEYLTQKLAPHRIDPLLKVTEEDSVTKMVRENLNRRTIALDLDKLEAPDNLTAEVDSILDNLFKAK
jgi:predicted ATP-binding protein involved in virulence